MKARPKPRRKGFLRGGNLSVCRRVLTGPLALIYALAATLPHVSTTSHVHEAGGTDHAHVVMSAHDVALERAVLALIPEGRPRGELASTSGTRVRVSRTETKIDAISQERRGVRSSESQDEDSGETSGTHWRDADLAAHTHGQALPNLPVPELAGLRVPTSITGLTPPVTVPPHVPALAILAAPARAPPCV